MHTLTTNTLYFILFFSISFTGVQAMEREKMKFFKASNEKFQYIGRIDFSVKELPRFWAPGIYIKARFKGTFCEIELNDEELYGKNHNYISVIIDDGPVQRIKLNGKNNIIVLADKLQDGEHEVVICKSTESNIGYLEFVGLRCEELLKPGPKKKRKMEFIGDSITCGMGSDLTEITCDSAAWFDQHNAYLSYGPITARGLNADWHLTAVSGIGLMKSCCDLKYTMPDVVDKINLRDNLLNWDFKSYQPDLVVICLGQNDGVLDSALFVDAYVAFLKRLHAYYPKAKFVCLTSPMADERLADAQKTYLKGITTAAAKSGISAVETFAFSKQYHGGCSSHPDLNDHTQIAKELSAFIETINNW